VGKRYLLLCHGRLPRGTWLQVGAPLRLLREPVPGGERRGGTVRSHAVVCEAGGRPARTAVQVVAHLVSNKEGQEAYSLAVAIPVTGRTHQIRCHLAYLGHPLVADPQYGGCQPDD
ncbi:unnamed protein product, partial [Polarella glacialis]